MGPILNLVMVVVLLVLSLLWYREGHIANLSLVSQGTRVVVVAFAILGLATVFSPVAKEVLGFVPFEDDLPALTWSIRTFIGIILLALVVTTARSRRNRRWHQENGPRPSRWPVKIPIVRKSQPPE